MGHSGDTTQTGAPTGDRSRDPFAPPPAGAPDRPWQPRGPVVPQGGGPQGGAPQGGTPQGSGQGGGPRPEGDGPHSGAGAPGQAGSAGASGGSGASGTAQPEGATAGTPEQGGAAGTPEHGGTPQAPGAAPGPQDGTPPARGRAHVPVPPPHPWSPGYQGQQPPTPRFQYQPPGPRFDPTDPVMRRSRYAVLCGIWGVPFMVLGIPYVSLLLGALAIYWGISALRGTPKPPNPLNSSPLSANGTAQGGFQGGVPGGVHGGGLPGQPVMPPTSPYHPAAQTRPQVPAALVGIVGGVVSLSLVAAVFAVQLYYKNYYDCQANALTKAAYDSCATSVSPRPPVWLTQFNGQ